MSMLKTSFQLAKLSFSIINKEKELLVYSILSAISTILVILSFFIFIIGVNLFSGAGFENQSMASATLWEFIFTILFYFILSLIALFFNTAIISSVNRVLKGEENSFGDGMRDAFSNIGKIITWAFISAFVSTILKMIQNRVPFIAKIIVGIVGAAWNLATFFAFPLMILDNKKVGESLKESPKLFAKTWGENVFSNIGVGLFFILMFIILVIVSVLLVILSFTTLAIIFFVLGFVLIILLYLTCDSVIKTLIYYYAKTGSLPLEVDSNLISKAMIREK